MKRPEDIQTPITAEQQRQIDELVAEVEKRLETTDDLQVATAGFHEVVRDEVARIVKSAGWDVQVRGSTVLVKRPSGNRGRVRDVSSVRSNLGLMSKFTPREEAEMVEARRRAKETLSNSHLPITFFFDGNRPEVKEETYRLLKTDGWEVKEDGSNLIASRKPLR